MAPHRTPALLACLAVLSFGAAPARAADLGTYGETFSISETDILEMLLTKLRAAERSGKIKELNKAFAERVKRRLERPAAVGGVATTVKPRSWLFDPSIIVPDDFRDPAGRLFARRGDRINPLERIPGGFNEELIFIDGDDPRQVAMGLARRKAAPDRTHVVLVKGAPLELMRKHKVQLFFDQEGKLTQHFSVRQVPAIVAKDKANPLRLRISEVMP